jgi:hypothetical protein
MWTEQAERLVVQRDLGKRNGLFLDFVARSGRLEMNAPAGAHVTPENVAVGWPS